MISRCKVNHYQERTDDEGHREREEKTPSDLVSTSVRDYEEVGAIVKGGICRSILGSRIEDHPFFFFF